MSKLEELVAKVEEAKQAVRDFAADHTADALAEIFAPLWSFGVTGVRWEQFTPYFADGDPCVFSVYEPSVTLSGLEDTDAGEQEDGWVEEFSLRWAWESMSDYNEPIRALLDKERAEALASALDEAGKVLTSEAMGEVLLVAYGDHAQIYVTPLPGDNQLQVDIDEYSHD